MQTFKNYRQHSSCIFYTDLISCAKYINKLWGTYDNVVKCGQSFGMEKTSFA